jgi:alpha-1,2-mannosyltransferase
MEQKTSPRILKTVTVHWPHLFSAALLVAFAATAIVRGVTHVTWDFIKAYYPAARAAAMGEPLTYTYDGYKNLPIIATALVPFGSADFATAERWFKVQEIAAYVLAFCVLGLRFGITRRRIWLLAALFVFSWPFVICVHLGQLTPLTLLVISGLLWSWLDGQRMIAGICLALGILLKLPIAIFALFFIVRREWLLLLSAAISFGAAIIAGIIRFGWSAHVDYLHMVIGKNENGLLLAYNNQNLSAFVGRFLYPPTLLDWSVKPVSDGLRLALLTGSIAILAAASWKAWRKDITDDAGRTAQFFTFVVASLLVAPISWDHYYLLLIVPTFLLISESNRRVGTMAAIALSSLLVNMPVFLGGSIPRSAISLVERYPAAMVLFSLPFIGGIIVFLLLVSFRESRLVQK